MALCVSYSMSRLQVESLILFWLPKILQGTVSIRKIHGYNLSNTKFSTTFTASHKIPQDYSDLCFCLSQSKMCLMLATVY
ncbi:hypothetical protein FKM82_000532 [Ascaphus truei]